MLVSDEITCSIPRSLIFDGGPGKDGIPALTNPRLVAPGDVGAAYLREEDRVIGLLVNGEPIAVPLNIGWWHEIVNLDLGSLHLAVTHCPLTGSSLIFDRAAADNRAFGVSGLLFMNNLIMYDRGSKESLWPQLLRGAGCGPRTGTTLAMFPAMEMTWAGWKALYPATKVISSETGVPRDYTRYPYGSYDQPDNPEVLFPMPTVDRRRPPKERVLGLPDSVKGGMAFPFGALADAGSVAAVDTVVAGRRVVVFWDAASQGAMAYYPRAAGRSLTFHVEGGQFVDRETRSVWRLDGKAVSGELAGAQLEAVSGAFVVYWFAWAAFFPDAALWGSRGTP